MTRVIQSSQRFKIFESESSPSHDSDSPSPVRANPPQEIPQLQIAGYVTLLVHYKATAIYRIVNTLMFRSIEDREKKRITMINNKIEIYLKKEE